MDGSGYPQRLEGDVILLEARIMMVAEISDAISNTRPYRVALSTEIALAEVVRLRGTMLDPDVVDACLSLYWGDDCGL
jgi:HD-GYP domain-containing protein (c-di-GMP phosphodiesterase class II)